MRDYIERAQALVGCVAECGLGSLYAVRGVVPTSWYRDGVGADVEILDGDHVGAVIRLPVAMVADWVRVA